MTIRASQLKGYPTSVYGRGAVLDFHSGGWLDAEDQAYIESIRTTGRLTSGVYSDLFKDNNLLKAETMQVAERRSRKADRRGSPFFADNTIDWEERWESENANYQLALAKKRAAVATRKKEALDAMAEEYRRYEEEKKQNKQTQQERDAEWEAAKPKIDKSYRQGPDNRFYRTKWSIWNDIDIKVQIIKRGRVRYDVADRVLLSLARARKEAREMEREYRKIENKKNEQNFFLYHMIKNRILDGIADGKMHKIDDLLAGIQYDPILLGTVIQDLQKERNIRYEEKVP